MSGVWKCNWTWLLIWWSATRIFNCRYCGCCNLWPLMRKVLFSLYYGKWKVEMVHLCLKSILISFFFFWVCVCIFNELWTAYYSYCQFLLKLKKLKICRYAGKQYNILTYVKICRYAGKQYNILTYVIVLFTKIILRAYNSYFFWLCWNSLELCRTNGMPVQSILFGKT